MVQGYEARIGNTIRTFTLEQVAERDAFTGDDDSKWRIIEVDDSPVIEVPQVVTPRQMRVALIMSGTSIASIEAMIAASPEPDQSIVRTTWEYSTEFKRDNEILNSMAGQLGLTQGDVDNLFILADTL